VIANAIALSPAELALLRRAIEILVEREGQTQAAADVVQMLERPLHERELLGLREGAEA
jgi:hypothetical protein